MYKSLLITDQKYKVLFQRPYLNSRIERNTKNLKLLSGLKSVKKVVPLGYQFKRIVQKANQNIYINQREETKIPSFEEIKN